MKEKRQLLISLEERHAINILSGTKRVELRRRPMHVEMGDLVWLYVKKPVGAIVGFAVVDSFHIAAPSSVWRKFGKRTGLVKSEFMSYFEGAMSAFALGVDSPSSLDRPIGLNELRDTVPNFHPPQFYCRLPNGSALRSLLSAATIGPTPQAA